MIIATSAPKKWKVGAELIKWYQGGTKYSHVLILKDDLVFQASHGNVNCQHIDVFLQNNDICDVFTIEEDCIDFEFVKKQLGKPYGFLQLVNLALKFFFNARIFKKDGDQKFICSEFVGKALKLKWVNDFTTPKEIIEYLKNRII